MKKKTPSIPTPKRGRPAGDTPPKPEGDEMIGIGVRVPRRVHDELRRMAYEQRVSINSILVAGAERMIAEDKR